MVCGTAGLDYFVFVLSSCSLKKCFGGFGDGANAGQTSSAAERGGGPARSAASKLALTFPRQQPHARNPNPSQSISVEKFLREKFQH